MKLSNKKLAKLKRSGNQSRRRYKTSAKGFKSSGTSFRRKVKPELSKGTLKKPRVVRRSKPRKKHNHRVKRRRKQKKR